MLHSANFERKIVEYYGNEKIDSYRVTNDGRGAALLSASSTVDRKRDWSKFSIAEFFREVFLPQGFPDSVTDDYVEYQLWDTLQAFCSSITGTLASQAVLKGVGVGDQNATVLAATMTWLLKDGAGMVSRICFAWIKGTELDCYSKKWRLVADLLNDLAIFVDLLAPHFKPLFTLLVCFSTTCRSIVGVAGGATRAALTQHQARRNNLADVSAKDGSQETLVNLSALCCSLILVPLIDGKQSLIWALFTIFTFMHVYANYRAVRSLRMDTLNVPRYRILIRHYLKTWHVLPVRQTNSLEPLFQWISRCRLKLGCSIKSTGFSTASVDAHALKLPTNHMIMVGWYKRRPTVNVMLNKLASVKDTLLAVFEAEIIVHNIEEKSVKELDLESIRRFANNEFEKFYIGLQNSGWNTNYCLFNFDEYRYSYE